MRAPPIAGLAVLLGSLACTGPVAPTGENPVGGELPRAEPGVLYALGAVLGEQMLVYQLDEEEAREVARGFLDGALRRTDSEKLVQETSAQFHSFDERRVAELARREELAGAPTLELAAREPGAVKTESGMVLRVIEPGSGPSPAIYDFVAVNYHGVRRDGSVFDTNGGGQPLRVQLGKTTLCWQEALAAVAPGARLHVVCPPSLGYGLNGLPGNLPGGAVLTYDLELLAVEPQP